MSHNNVAFTPVSNQLIIEIDDPHVETRGGISNGREWSSHKQVGYLRRPRERYPAKIEFQVEDPRKAYAPGVYVVDVHESTFIGKYKDVQYAGRLVLHPYDEKAAKAS